MFHILKKLSSLSVKKLHSFVYKNITLRLYSRRLNRHNTFECKGILHKCRLSVNGANNSIIISERCRLNNVVIQITGNNNRLYLDEGVVFSEGGRIRIEDSYNVLHIGKNSIMIDVFFSLADIGTSISVGDNCLFSKNIIVRTSDSHSILDLSRKRINDGQNVSFGNHVWVGYGATILKGASIGNNCVIGTQSLVTGKSFLDGSLVAGSPAKILKQGINWSIARIHNKE